MNTPICLLGDFMGCRLFLKREDLIPFSFGGNKARKARLFFEDFDRGDFDCVVTYGSSSSNHCRVVANICASRGIGCYIIGPREASEATFNSRMMELFGAEITVVPVSEVSATIEAKLDALRAEGRRPYFIPGGGHGNIGTQAFVDCYNEIRDCGTRFDYIFFASGTGTTQAGLVAGKLMSKGQEQVVGISIARKNPRGRQVVIDSIKEYLPKGQYEDDEIERATLFLDDYTGNGYAQRNEEIERTIREVLVRYGVPLDSTYTGKAFAGMKDYLLKHDIKGKNILFIHTGGTPLFFDNLTASQYPPIM